MSKYKKGKKNINKNISNNNPNIWINASVLIISIFLLGLVLMERFISTDTFIETFLGLIVANLKIIFGKTVIVFLLLVILFNFFAIRNRKKISSMPLIRKIMWILSFLFLSMSLTVFSLAKITGETMFDAGQEILANAFMYKGGGIIGAIISIPFFTVVNEPWFFFSAITMFLITSFFAMGKTIRLIYLNITNTLDYYSSEEYLNKKKIIEAKKTYEKRLQEAEDKQFEESFVNYFVNKTNKKLEDEIFKKLDEDKTLENKEVEYYSEKELNAKQKEWNEYYYRMLEIRKYEIEKAKLQQEKKVLEKIEKENYEALNRQEKQLEQEDKEEKIEIPETFDEIDEIEEEVFEIDEPIDETSESLEEIIPEPVQVIDREELKVALADVFKDKSMDPEKISEMKREIEKNIENLEEVLRNFGVDAKVVDYGTGPTITRYEIKIPKNVRVKKVTELEDDIAMYLKAERIRIEAPIPGKDAIGIETPNKIKEPVYFSNLIKSRELEQGILPVVLGKDIVGNNKIIDIAKLPHLLIAGTTGSGKSVCINTIISSLISKKSDDEVKFIMVDPKMVELMPYNGIAHLLTPVIIDPNMAAIALKWAVNEMEERYKKLASLGLRNIEAYNKKYVKEKLPYIVIIIDELADLMMVSSNNVEQSIARIAQKARAIGIHLIVATQRPSVDVVTGMIKANLPSRISFALRSNTDSRTILDQVGAEKLLGMGDMLFLDNGKAKLERVQGAYISDDEINKLTDIIKSKKVAVYNEEILVEEEQGNNNNRDPLYEKAVLIAKRPNIDRLSISLLQRELSTGFNRASKLCEELRNNGVIDEQNRYINSELD
ncbi:DNA translocase FtsK [Streptobacillus moniliformis]|uniref:DNA translocase FtsK n=1 Tax=Streptobacillus moniliformis TaxID=34105 RepID=UPI0009BF2572|nr:DNA translocase FtsK [Streptobacillus moniliformis]